MSESPLTILIIVAISAYLGHLWWTDYTNYRKGNPNPHALAGATTCPRSLVIIGAIGAVVLTILETLGEYALNISSEQKDITVLYLAAMLAAAFGEELIFRGYCVVTKKGKAMLLTSIVLASVSFALAHDFLWQFTMPENAAWWECYKGFSLNFTLKGWFSFAFVFIASLYFYALRFHPKNSKNSLIPCIAAHAAKNIAVFAIKLAQGHVCGLY